MHASEVQSVEVAVVGGGPVGTLCAAKLNQLGHQVALIHYEGPRQNWVELITPQTALSLDLLTGSSDWRTACGHPCRGIVDSWLNEEQEFQDFELFRCGPGWVVNRPGFEMTLREQIAKSNNQLVVATPKPARLIDYSDRDALVLRLDGRKINALYVIDATGKNSRLIPGLGGHRLRFDRLVAIGFSVKGNREFSDCLRLASSSSGWWYEISKDATYGFRVFLTDGDLLPSSGPLLQRLLEMQWQEAFGNSDISHDKPSDFHIRDARTGCSQHIWGDRWLRIGDAAFSIDPITGSGLANITTAVEIAMTGVSEYLLHRKTQCLQEYTAALEKMFLETLQRLHQLYSNHIRATAHSANVFWNRRASANSFLRPI